MNIAAETQDRVPQPLEGLKEPRRTWRASCYHAWCLCIVSRRVLLTPVRGWRESSVTEVKLTMHCRFPRWWKQSRGTLAGGKKTKTSCGFSAAM